MKWLIILLISVVLIGSAALYIWTPPAPQQTVTRTIELPTP